MDELEHGFVFTNLVETDQVYGHRQDVPGFHDALQQIDDAVGGVAGAARPGARPARHHRRPRLRPDDARARTTRASTSRCSPRSTGTAAAATTARSPTSARRCSRGSPVGKLTPCPALRSSERSDADVPGKNGATMRRRTLAGLLPLLAAAAVGGCGGGGDGDGKQAADEDESQQELLDSVDTRPRDVDESDEEIKRLLADRAAAIEQRDAKAIGGHRARARSAPATGARAANLAGAAARRRPARADATSQISGRKATMRARMRYRDPGRHARVRDRAQDRRAQVGRPAGRSSATSPPDALPWEVAALQGDHAVAPHRAAHAARGGRGRRSCPAWSRAYRRISRDLPARDLPDRVLVLAASDGDEVEAARRQGAREQRRGDGRRRRASSSRAARSRSQRVLAQRMTLDHGPLRAMPGAGARVDARPRDGPHRAGPGHVGRGRRSGSSRALALYVSREDLSAYTGAVEAAGVRPRSAQLSRRERDRQARRRRARAPPTSIASAAADEIADRKGNEGLFRFFEAFNDSHDHRPARARGPPTR